MSKKEFRQLIVLGFTTGLAAIGQPNLINGLEEKGIQPFLAAHRCKGKDGCGNLTALRETSYPAQEEEESGENVEEEGENK